MNRNWTVVAATLSTLQWCLLNSGLLAAAWLAIEMVSHGSGTAMLALLNHDFWTIGGDFTPIWPMAIGTGEPAQARPVEHQPDNTLVPA